MQAGGILNFIKKRLQHRSFPVKFAKFLRTPILKSICERLLLHIKYYTSATNTAGPVTEFSKTVTSEFDQKKRFVLNGGTGNLGVVLNVVSKFYNSVTKEF